jgi:ABC-type sulfate/molybdate transport systems ATPase subunit
VAEEALLQARITHHIGGLHLEAQFHLSAAWTILFGPSGAGKSTVLRILAGLMTPEHGRILLRNRLLLDTTHRVSVPPGHRGIGFLTQQPTLFPHMSVRKNIGFGLVRVPQKERESRVQEMLSLFRIESLADRMPSRLSGGEYQRVALARSLAPRPALLLLDEPFTGLDGALKASILEDLSSWLSKSQTAVLYVSHDLVEAFQTKAEVLLLEEGRIQAQGDPSVVLAQKREQLLRQLTAAQ